MVDLSVIILSWNTITLLAECLVSVAKPHPGITVEVIVVDNASEDGSREMVKRRFPDVKLVVNETNIGFGAGNNSALPVATGRYVMFLNSDTVVLEDAFRNLVCFADANPDVGIAGPKLLNTDGSLQYSCRSYPNLATGFFRNTPLGRLLPKNRHTTDYLLKDWDHATPRDVDWLSGAALMMRRELLDQIGAFDLDYWMYCEDVDLCWRANHAEIPAAYLARVGEQQSVAEGMPRTWRVTYYPGSVIYHHIGKSSDRVPTRMTYEFHRSQYLFYKKHYASSYSPLIRPLIPAGIAMRAVGQLIRYRMVYWRKRLRGEIKPLHKDRSS